ncbi:trehalose-phosphatase [Acetobacter ascendens]|uniref:Trehalose 6-phosphate phosphatase n=1 Tax=Acetobacter ascendens TaxID=481146 RepID=A0A1D8QY56_9PROT|nr:trehalose-phosphatase [Acetobacter ascendens]AOW47273.1 trehalose-phosphatase [Acetobacter ascendens]ARW10141.1 Trehalose-phosphatase [Acetobacter ascendens]RCL09471.1 trehalose-phosphatase [Acetobacter pasteurianus]GCD73841.1 trehalose phosphatase [Acetobacter pasteurianus NBRC 3299]
MLGSLGAQDFRFHLPPLNETAFLLDFDGTLVDIAPTPESVVVPNGLLDSLRHLREACGDALAVVSGRPIDQIDHFLGDVPFAVAGEHGVAIRHRPGGPIERAALPSLPLEWLAQARDLLATLPGTRLEHKEGGFVLHYRAAPEAAETLRQAASEWVQQSKGTFLLLPAKMAWEIRPAGIDKGYAVSLLMESPPFTGRKPVFVGDDVTDEDAIAAVRRMGGVGLRIPSDFPTPSIFRAWLGSLTGGSR